MVDAHTYVIGGNSEAEHFRPPNAIASHLDTDTCEGCNTYNMLRLTRELWLLEPDNAAYFDYYERALLNHLIGWQNPADAHGHITYFTPLNPGGRRGVGPAWGGGTWSTDYNSFWCCQGTGIETFTKLMDSVYFRADTTLYVNLYTPSRLNWTERGITVVQSTSYPVSDTSTLTVTGSASGIVDDAPAHPRLDRRRADQRQRPGPVHRRDPRHLRGADPLVGLGRHRHREAPDERGACRRPTTTRTSRRSSSAPRSSPGTTAAPPSARCRPSTSDSIERTSTSSLAFTATADGADVNLGPFFDAHGHNYTVYWNASGEGGSTCGARVQALQRQLEPRARRAGHVDGRQGVSRCSGTTRAPPTTSGRSWPPARP